MKVLLADDSEIALNSLTAKLDTVSAALQVPIEILGTARDGKQLLTLFTECCRQALIDCIFCDIRMPVEDGLTTLVKIRAMKPTQGIVMVSSEDMSKMEYYNRFRGFTGNADLEWQKKTQLLDKIVARVQRGIHEPGKIHSVLEGCEKLAADPILVAHYLGANGYLHKPYTDAKVMEMLSKLKEPTFALVA